MIELREMIVAAKYVSGVLKYDDEYRFTVFLSGYDKPISFGYEDEESYKKDLNKLLSLLETING